MITLEPVQSSFIQARGYNAGQQLLGVQFNDGTIVHYAGVPIGMWERFRDASSPGSFFHLHIRGKFPAKKQTDPRPACDCIVSGNVNKPKQHGADAHAKNCAIYQTRWPPVHYDPAAVVYPSPCCGQESVIHRSSSTHNLMRCSQCGSTWRA